MFLILAGTLMGYTESHKLTRRVDRLEAFLRFISAAQTEIRYSGTPIRQIIRLHGEELTFLTACLRDCAVGVKFSDAWRRSVEREAKAEGFSPSDRKLLLAFGGEFGGSDTEGQLSLCSLYLTLFQGNLKTAKEEKNKKSRLYLTLGIFGGLAASLLLC